MNNQIFHGAVGLIHGKVSSAVCSGSPQLRLAVQIEMTLKCPHFLLPRLIEPPAVINEICFGRQLQQGRWPKLKNEGVQLKCMFSADGPVLQGLRL